MTKPTLILLICSFFYFTSHAMPSPLKMVWSKGQSCQAPESVYYDEPSGTLYVSNVVGTPNQKDGQGWIQKLDTAGNMIAEKWVDGLNAPKGLRAHGGTLWVSDIDDLIGIEMKTGKIITRIRVSGAEFLNDVAVGADGTVYVSDTIAWKIFQIKPKGENFVTTVFAEGPDLESPNGLLVVGNELVVASWGKTKDWTTPVLGNLYALDLQNSKKKRSITKKPLGNLDGLELDKNGNFIVSDWAAGKVFKVDAKSGKSELLISGLQGSADLAVDAKDSLVIVPRMKENLVTAYKLK